MKIYFAAAISAGRDYAEVYRKIVDDLKKSGHQVLTEHVADPDVLKKEKNISPEEVYLRDIELLQRCDVLLAEISKPSTGVGYEIAYALHALKKPVICVYLKGLRMTKMITGNTEPLLRVYAYESVNELLDSLPALLEEAEQKVRVVNVDATNGR